MTMPAILELPAAKQKLITPRTIALLTYLDSNPGATVHDIIAAGVGEHHWKAHTIHSRLKALSNARWVRSSGSVSADGSSDVSWMLTIEGRKILRLDPDYVVPAIVPHIIPIESESASSADPPAESSLPQVFRDWIADRANRNGKIAFTAADFAIAPAPAAPKNGNGNENHANISPPAAHADTVEMESVPPAEVMDIPLAAVNFDADPVTVQRSIIARALAEQFLCAQYDLRTMREILQQPAEAIERENLFMLLLDFRDRLSHPQIGIHALATALRG